MDDMDPVKTIYELLPLLGSPDKAIRDDYTYMIFAYWLTEYDVLTGAELLAFTDYFLGNNFLLQNITVSDGNSVLLRSFSLLLLDLLLQADMRQSFLQIAEQEKIIEQLTIVANKECDIRGYTEEYGWVHTLAHFSDSIATMMLHPNISRIMKKQGLQLLMQYVSRLNSCFTAGEDDRIAHALWVAIKEKVVSPKELSLLLANAKQDDVPFDIRKMNYQHILRSLFVRNAQQKILKEDFFYQLEKQYKTYNARFMEL